MITIKGHKFYTLEEVLKKDLKSKTFREGYYKEVARLRMVGEMRRVRMAKKLSQKKLAEKADTTQSVIARIESGRQGITFSTMARIAAALGKQIQLV